MQSSFKCEYCDKEFVKEKTLFVHVCEQKRRYLSKNEKHVQAGLMTYQKFYEFTQKGKNQKTFEDFASSPYYSAFVKFGSFLINTAPIYPELFVEYVVKSGVKLDHWCRDELYEQYLFEMLKVEPVESAVQRTLQTMMEWGDEHNANFAHYFNYVSLNKAVYDIVNGKISCWVLLNCVSGKDMAGKMNDEQLAMIAPAFDIKYWLKKFKEFPADVALVKEILAEAGVK